MAAKGNFGFAVDNTIGATPQPNGWMDNWVDFFRERRLRHQLQLASAWPDLLACWPDACQLCRR
jgi:fructosamine-3-kinase